MTIAYKYLKFSDGVIVVFSNFDKNLLLKKNDVQLTYSISSENENEEYLKIANDYYIPLTKNFLDYISEYQKIYIAVSGHFSYEINVIGEITIDKILVGKLLAYLEMNTKHN